MWCTCTKHYVSKTRGNPLSPSLNVELSYELFRLRVRDTVQCLTVSFPWTDWAMLPQTLTGTCYCLDLVPMKNIKRYRTLCVRTVLKNKDICYIIHSNWGNTCTLKAERKERKAGNKILLLILWRFYLILSISPYEDIFLNKC